MTHPSKSKVRTSEWLKWWFMRERNEDRQWIKKRWHHQPANGKHWAWCGHSGLKAKRKWLYLSHVGKFRDNHDSFKNRKKIEQRAESKMIIRRVLAEVDNVDESCENTY